MRSPAGVPPGSRSTAPGACSQPTGSPARSSASRSSRAWVRLAAAVDALEGDEQPAGAGGRTRHACRVRRRSRTVPGWSARVAVVHVSLPARQSGAGQARVRTVVLCAGGTSLCWGNLGLYRAPTAFRGRRHQSL